MQLRVSDLLNDLHERTDIVEERIEGIENNVKAIQEQIELLPNQIGSRFDNAVLYKVAKCSTIYIFIFAVNFKYILYVTAFFNRIKANAVSAKLLNGAITKSSPDQ